MYLFGLVCNIVHLYICNFLIMYDLFVLVYYIYNIKYRRRAVEQIDAHWYLLVEFVCSRIG